MSDEPTDAAATQPRWADIQAHRPLEAADPREIGGYRLRAYLGGGGMGRVYLSYTPGGRPIAIKVIRPEYASDPAFRRRFEQEVTTAQRVHGLYTAPVIDANPRAEQPWLATAYVPGPSLQDIVGTYGPLPEESVLVLVAGVAEALNSIHSAGVIHRDLKPSNVILAVDGPRVIDFGIARAVDTTSVTQTGHVVGTPAFMAPEQVRGQAVTPALDIFALGALACYAATGELPFGGGLDPAVPYRILEQEPDLATCPKRLVDLVTRCLAKDPRGRPSPTQVIELCRNLSTGTRLQMGDGWLPPPMAAAVNRIATAPVPPVAQPRQPPKRRKRIAVLLTVTFVVLAAGIGIGSAALAGVFDTTSSGSVSSLPTSTTVATSTVVPTTTVGQTSQTSPQTGVTTSSGTGSAPTRSGGGLLIKHEDSVVVADGHGINFTNNGLERTKANNTPNIYYNNALFYSKADAVILQPGTPATFESCTTDQRFVTSVYIPDLSVDENFCILTGTHVALLETRRLPQQNEASSYYEFAITVWKASA